MNAIVASQVRRLPTTLTLLLLLLAAYLAASLVNSVIASNLAPVMPPRPPKDPHPASATAPSPLSSDTLAKLLGLPERADAAPEPADDVAPVSLPYQLVGTMVANEPAWSFALLQNLTTREAAVYAVGQAISGGFVAAIDRLEVQVNLNGRLVSIDRASGNSETAHDVPAAAARESSGAVRSLGNHRREVLRSAAETIFTEGLPGIRIIPAYRDGKPQGFNLVSFPKDSPLAELGLRPGDILLRANGFELTSPDKVLRAYSQLREASRVELEVERAGATIRETYLLR